MMAPHYTWIRAHLLLIAESLESTLQDEIPSVRLRAARCLDLVVHSINTHLLSQSSTKNADFENDVEIALQFWSKIFTILSDQIEEPTQNSATKSTICDAYSNIGVHVYERLPVNKTITFADYCISRNIKLMFFAESQTNPHNLIAIGYIGWRWGDHSPRIGSTSIGYFRFISIIKRRLVPNRRPQ